MEFNLSYSYLNYIFLKKHQQQFFFPETMSQLLWTIHRPRSELFTLQRLPLKTTTQRIISMRLLTARITDYPE